MKADADTIQKILDINEPRKIIVDDREYFDRALIPVKNPEPTSLPIHTLTGIEGYVKTCVEETEDRTDFIIHIETHRKVFLITPLIGDFKQRFTLVTAEHSQPVFKFGEFMDVELFNIKLQSMFVQDAVTAEILRIIGNLKDGTVRTVADDGVSQSVTTKTGVATVEEMTVPNPVALKPYRTFPEIEQPGGLFVHRLISGAAGENPRAALFEADGGQWQNVAIHRIKTWLQERLPDIPIIA